MRTFSVATALTVYGIETTEVDKGAGDFPRKLQQHLPFTVLKLDTPIYIAQCFSCNSTYRLRY